MRVAASSGISGHQLHKGPEFPRERLRMGVADRAVVLKEIIPHVCVLKGERSSTLGSFCLVSQQEARLPPGSCLHSFQTCDPNELLRNFWEFSHKVQSFFFFLHDSETNRNQGQSTNGWDFLQFKSTSLPGSRRDWAIWWGNCWYCKLPETSQRSRKQPACEDLEQIPTSQGKLAGWWWRNPHLAKDTVVSFWGDFLQSRRH